MKLRHLLPILLATATLISLAPTPARAREGRTLSWDLQDERFKGISVQLPASFMADAAKKLDFDFTLKVTNNRPEPVSLKKWELKLQATNLGKGTFEGGELKAKAVTLAPGESQELKGHFHMGADAKSLGIGLSKGGASKDLSYDRIHGDALAGFIMTIATSNKEEFKFYLAKYHYEQASDTITAYSVLGK